MQKCIKDLDETINKYSKSDIGLIYIVTDDSDRDSLYRVVVGEGSLSSVDTLTRLQDCLEEVIDVIKEKMYDIEETTLGIG